MIVNGEFIHTPWTLVGFARFAEANPGLNLDASVPQFEFLKDFADITLINGGGDGSPFFVEGLLQGLPFSYREERGSAVLRVAQEMKVTEREVVDVRALEEALGLNPGGSPSKPYPKTMIEEIEFPYNNTHLSLSASCEFDEDEESRRGWQWVETFLRLVEALRPVAPRYSFGYELVTEKDGVVERMTGEVFTYHYETAEAAREHLMDSWVSVFENFPGKKEFTWSETPTTVDYPISVEKIKITVPDEFRNTEGLIAFNYPVFVKV